MIDISTWAFDTVIGLRSESLTLFFKIMPFFASDIFYILTIAIGFWRYPRHSPQHRLFLDLGLLVPFSTFLNCSLKNLFAIPRPDVSFHLVPIQEPFGFPSGDVQVAVVFWGLLCLGLRSWGLSLFSVGLIVTMMISRLYLGVHSFYDVTGGLLIGILTLWIYRMPRTQLLVTDWFSGKKIWSYWGIFLACVGFFLATSYHIDPTPMVVAAFGTFLGYGFFLQTISRQERASESGGPLLILLSLGILFIFVLIFPTIKDGSQALFWGTGLVKYAFVAFLIFSLLPRLQRWVVLKG